MLKGLGGGGLVSLNMCAGHRKAGGVKEALDSRAPL